MTIGGLLPGVAAETILPRAAAIVREVATVEADDLEVVGGAARVIVRFTGDDDGAAERIAEHALAGMGVVATVSGLRVTRRTGSRWVPIA